MKNRLVLIGLTALALACAPATRIAPFAPQDRFRPQGGDIWMTETLE